MLKVAIAAAVGLVAGAGGVGGYFVAQERTCAVLDVASQETFDDASAALASVVAADPDRYVVMRDYLDLRDNTHHTEFGFFVDGEPVEEVNVYEATAGSWSVFGLESCEGPTMP